MIYGNITQLPARDGVRRWGWTVVEEEGLAGPMRVLQISTGTFLTAEIAATDLVRVLRERYGVTDRMPVTDKDLL